MFPQDFKNVKYSSDFSIIEEGHTKLHSKFVSLTENNISLSLDPVDHKV